MLFILTLFTYQFGFFYTRNMLILNDQVREHQMLTARTWRGWWEGASDRVLAHTHTKIVIKANVSFSRTAHFDCHIPYRGMIPSFLAVVHTPPAEWDPRSEVSTFVVLENTAKLKPVSKRTSVRWRERTMSLPIALFWRSNRQEIRWLVKEMTSFLKHWIYTVHGWW